MSSITAIQQSDSLYGIFGTNTRAKGASPTPSIPGSKSDTVTFSEEALALIERKRREAAEEEEAALHDTLERTGTRNGAETVSLKDTGKSLFAMMLESLFLADLDENSQAAAQTAGDGMPRKQANPLQDGEKVAEIKDSCGTLQAARPT